MKYSKVRENYKDYTVNEFLDEKRDELRVDDVVQVLLDKELQIFDRGQGTKLICNEVFHVYLSNMTRYSKITPDYNHLKGLSDQAQKFLLRMVSEADVFQYGKHLQSLIIYWFKRHIKDESVMTTYLDEFLKDRNPDDKAHYIQEIFNAKPLAA